MTLPTYLASLASLTSRPELIVAGAMSGTSVDSIDVGICRITSRQDHRPVVSLASFFRHEIPLPIKTRVLRGRELSVEDVGELNVLIGHLFAQAVIEADKAWGEGKIDLIGSHGQTVYHHSGLDNRIQATLQVGCGDIIATETGILTISDFRAKDVAVGGEGAPLVPHADDYLFAGSGCRAVINLGGIANVTLLGLPHGDVVGFDTGPANGPLDRLARKISRGEYELDRDGLIASRGVVSQEFLNELLADPYLSRLPPKSTGPEMYGDDFVEGVIRRFGRVDADLLATMTEFVARSVADAIIRFSPEPVQEVIVSGGGANNRFLIDRVRSHLSDIPLYRSDEKGVPSHAREVMAFALLAYDALMGRPTSRPSVTGARYATRLGKFSFPD